ncbi:unnamed protein product [Adineta steineri]|uniref:Uncharacterized protein n=1 Tax=Adineta steineri TaxID=433720 RepID=A0A819CQE5_9BILA|nr:unnamed protein product [Adineta steineri]CAF3823933.1 unnamed protein product [Adineta steineri]
MNCIVSTIFIVVVLNLTIENLDARKIESSLNNGQKQIIKRRSKRNTSSTPFSFFSNQPSPYINGDSSNCEQSAAGFAQVGVKVQKKMDDVEKNNLCVIGRPSMSTLQNGGMCGRNSNYLTTNGFAALCRGHTTISQLSTLNLFPVSFVDISGLRNAAYLNKVGQSTILSPLGILASLFGHILPSQLRPLNIYPLQNDMMTSGSLQNAGYLNSDCLPTALGCTASYIGYLPKNYTTSACQTSDDSPMTVERLANAKYIHGPLKLITSVGIVAIINGVLSRDDFKNAGCYPFVSGDQTPTSDDASQDQQTSLISSLVHTGYFFSNNLISNFGYYAISRSYFTIDQFRDLNLWPYPGEPCMDSFIAAGYASYSGHLTTLGFSLLHAQYFSFDSLAQLGIQIHDDCNIHHHAMTYGGFCHSAYHNTHTTAGTAGGYSSNGGQPGQGAQNPPASNGNGQYGSGPNSNSQYGSGPNGNGQYGSGPNSNGQYGSGGPNGNSQYGSGPNGNGQYSSGSHAGGRKSTGSSRNADPNNPGGPMDAGGPRNADPNDAGGPMDADPNSAGGPKNADPNNTDPSNVGPNNAGTDNDAAGLKK